MRQSQRIGLTLLRLGLGWVFLYAGATKLLNPEWSAAGYISNALTFGSLFEWLASPSNIVWVNFLNQWGLTLIGVALILGIFVRYASIAGIALMVLYWLPLLQFPLVGDHSYLIDDHIIYILAFVILIVFKSGRYWGFDKFLKKVT